MCNRKCYKDDSFCTTNKQNIGEICLLKEQEAKSEYQVIDGKKVHVITPEVEITLTNTENR